MSCSKCAACCRLFLVSLSEEEYNSKKYKTFFGGYIKEFQEAELTGRNLLAQKQDKGCFYLKNSRCSIYKDRPQCCRNFSCKSNDEKLKEPIAKLKKFKEKNKIN